MKLSDYIVTFLIEKGVTDVFGYPGGMVTHLMESFDKYKDFISAHVNYHEQASAFCACGYAQASNKPGVAYATSGPGATNLITGIANAYFDSIPCIFITGQVNTYESKGELHVRQKGFQETDIISIVKSITKYAVKIDDENNVKYEFEKAFDICISGRPGPVLIDIPMNILRADIIPDDLKHYEAQNPKEISDYYNYMTNTMLQMINFSRRPVILAGNGINIANVRNDFRDFVNLIGIPVVTSMIGRDVLPNNVENGFGFVGAYGDRCANFIISNSDLIISIGSRIDCRQTGSNLKMFGENAKIIRLDIDSGELTNKIKADEIDFVVDLKKIFPILNTEKFELKDRYEKWLNVCKEIREELKGIDSQYETDIIEELSYKVPEDSIITTDVGQNQVWVAQSFNIRSNQKMLFSGGHGAMGYSLPSAIGAYYGSRKNVICFNGDGGLQMNIQELQFIVREKIPVKIILLNNKSLGMIRHFQEMYFESNFVQTKKDGGYTIPDFDKISNAYGLRYINIKSVKQISECEDILIDDKPCFIELSLTDTTYVSPKLAMGKPIHDQDPLLDRDLFNRLIKICNI
ncbi:acetolactate synthase-1/2/3 large subunit [Clostridium saccharoperbutylacetonicum]|uniref:Acetolactate synthase isozyme 2 large subunit IlvG n=1 Tax=Clostridium saccharoperbutylacetonicum N1-4(HMT) TaxID=931276 RepID=M1MX58_9CLOT|nr:thiamine pyrophosphate-binding protein [Clostridium saccharoperbutylacetonicum]AGF59156.1 acetolactate synthase isozyme 2 large subunit IlvG [Clostridium saccharoperbutylacetonicum N1-4(HMT)]NRT60057.1 acetolactate synthase-1/2/3 large subunit [Clostridium saccharoperbutylacetonicum]NSB23369.1 acetolactate synthase-1/2/3 large subunit [Clostridium saccharoperbutylacetonicum]NSB42739.1 acetolactate synthase-1/2/3 large subunit [Clostridium saccharoperbutylacetonicum]